MKRVAIFASGSGSNYEAIMSAPADIQVSLLVSDKPQAYVLERAKKWGTPTFSLSPKGFDSKGEFEQHILQKLEEMEIDFIVLAGYMRLLGPTLLKPYGGRIINIHPSLLPAFPGKDAIGQAIKYGVRVSGVTVHFVDEGMDTGPIIEQQTVALDPGETKESLAKKVQAVEHDLYPKIIKACVQGDIELEGGHVRWVQQ